MTGLRASKGITDRHALIGIIAFFGVVFVANGFLVYWALATHGGVDTRDAYRTGLAYNERIAAEERQKRMGWTYAVAARAGSDTIKIRLKTDAGAPVAGYVITARLGRPVTNAFDAVLPVRETSPGLYEARAKGPLGEGNWVLEFAVSDKRAAGGDTLYRGKRRLWLRR